MSDTKKATETKETRNPYVVDIEPIPFNGDYDGKIMTSNNFCKMVNQVYKAAFADFEGCMFEVINGVPFISFIFNHTRPTEDGIYACERSGAKSEGNTIIDRARNRDRQLREGDRYYLTEDGKDVILELLAPMYYKNGKPDWSKLVSDFSDRTVGNMYGHPANAPQLTKVSGIDPKLLCAKFWGRKGGADYGVEVKYNLAYNTPMMPGGQQNPNYVLAITKANGENLRKTCNALGIGTIGSNIIR